MTVPKAAKVNVLVSEPLHRGQSIPCCLPPFLSFFSHQHLLTQGVSDTFEINLEVLFHRAAKCVIWNSNNKNGDSGLQ